MEKIEHEGLEAWLESKRNSLQKGQRTEFIVEHKAGLFPVAIDLSTEFADRLLVTFNGALDRARASDGIVFQRSTWVPEIQGSVIGFADPTLVEHEGMTLGWGQLTKDSYAPPVWGDLIRRLRLILDLPPARKTIYYGTSAGGFQALSSAVWDREARVLVNNPQLDWYKYSASFAVNKVCNKVLGDPSGNKTLSEQPWRIRVWELFIKESYFPPVELHVNIASHNDYQVQLKSFLTALPSLEYLDTQWRLNISLYRDVAAGHSPMAKGPMLRLINRALNEL